MAAGGSDIGDPAGIAELARVKSAEDKTETDNFPHTHMHIHTKKYQTNKQTDRPLFYCTTMRHSLLY